MSEFKAMNNDEIKEILDYLKKDDDKDYWGYAKDKLLAYEEGMKLVDCITNLQHQLSATETNEETFRLEMQEITKILGLDEDTLFDDVKEYAKNLKEEKEDYKSRNEKALEYIMTNLITEWDIKNDGYVSGSDLPVDAITPLLSILQGDDKNVKD